MKELNLRVCKEEARELILDWLIPLTENGTMDELMKAFVQELEPFAVEAAQRALRSRLMPGAPDIFLPRLKTFLESLAGMLEGIQLNPDMMAVAHDHEREIARASAEIRDWIHFLTKANAVLTSAKRVGQDAAALNGKGGAR